MLEMALFYYKAGSVGHMSFIKSLLLCSKAPEVLVHILEFGTAAQNHMPVAVLFTV